MTVALPPAARDDELVELDGQPHLRIPDALALPSFLMSLVSDSDLWLYVSSSGGLTAGRVDEEHCLFPYETVDRLHRAAGRSGPLTLVRAGGRLWEPFATWPTPGVARSLAKTVLSHSLRFDERETSLGLSFAYRWSGSEQFGWVRTAELTNTGAAPVRVELLDGLVGLLPAGVALSTQQTFSCLVDAYKQSEYDPASGLATYAMASLLTDRAEPAEALRANTVWSRGLPGATVLLSERQLARFRAGGAPTGESWVTGQPGAFLLVSQLTLAAGESVSWDIVADVARSQTQAVALRTFLLDSAEPRAVVAESVAAAGHRLRRVLATADSQQCTGDALTCAHHVANVLFNGLRGGFVMDAEGVDRRDVAAFIGQRNRAAATRWADWLGELPPRLPYAALRERAAATGSAEVCRLVAEYLPLAYGRRHGDPSRPWNRFAIRVRQPDGQLALDYQGNWRDIFQNWEALCRSHPDYLESVIAKFVNASTRDGFNPYRVTREGLDWEAPEPGHPWGNLGYWGDHQIIYLCRLLEASRAHHPGALEALLDQPRFGYADVPYRLKRHAEILADPRHTIRFDAARHTEILARAARDGSDARLVQAAGGGVWHVTLAEKLLVPLLSKLSNLVPAGGIWMNTQRPEWNDANNALAGYGVSVVTLAYLRRHLLVCRALFAGGPDSLALSSRVLAWLQAVHGILVAERDRLLVARVDDRARRRVLDALGGAFETYRDGLDAPDSPAPVARDALLALCDAALPWLDQALAANRRDDGLYHAYNLLVAEPDGETAALERLDVMLEGQVAVLSAGVLRPAAAADLLDALYASPLYRADQDSFLLYPDRRLPGFLQKNQVPAAWLDDNPLLRDLLAAGETTVVERDAAGVGHFAGELRNAGELSQALAALAQQPRWRQAVAAHGPDVLTAYEAVFRHHAFTGRSGGMYGYEGLGCIYWHMVAKLLVAVQECWESAVRVADTTAASRLAAHYQRVRAGLGFNKTAAAYGAFPTDPYSHTPPHAGAQQPGMTGQVKEELLTRWGELGVQVDAGRVRLAPHLLPAHEWLTVPTRWELLDAAGEATAVELPAGSLGFTLCGTPVLYGRGAVAGVEAVWRDGRREATAGEWLSQAASASLLARDGRLAQVNVTVCA